MLNAPVQYNTFSVVITFITCDFWSVSSLKKDLLSVELLLKNLLTPAHFKRLIPKRSNAIFGLMSMCRSKNCAEKTGNESSCERLDLVTSGIRDLGSGISSEATSLQVFSGFWN